MSRLANGGRWWRTTIRVRLGLALAVALAPVLLLSATPIHNSRSDLSAIVALFTGMRAHSMTDSELAELIVRREVRDASTADRIPTVEHAPPRVLRSGDHILDMILALPPPVPPSDGTLATRLVVHGLVRQWASSTAALSGALRRRLGRAHALLASLQAGRYPTGAELAAWICSDNSVQLAFPELLPPAAISLEALASALSDHVTALTAIDNRVSPLADATLAEFMRGLRHEHPGEKIVAFTCYAETAESLYASLRRDGHVALLTARGGTIASGPVRRDEVMAQFAPSGRGKLRVNDHRAIDLLIATDLLSEGVDLQEASVVVHLDLPWTHARLEQRVGRLARLGSRHPRVVSYSIHPPERADCLLREMEIITRKFGVAVTMLGDSDRDGAALASHSRVRSAELRRTRLDCWRSSQIARPTNLPATAVARWHRASAAVGAWIVDGTPMLLALHEDSVTDDHDTVDAALDAVACAADASEGSVDASFVQHVLERAQGWYEQRSAWHALGPNANGATPFSASAHRTLARVADATMRASSFATRARAASVAARLRGAAASPLPLAVEWSLQGLENSPDDACVNSILELVERSRADKPPPSPSGFHCVALIILAPASERC